MARKFTIGGRKKNSPRRVDYRMTNGRAFYEKSPRTFPYGVMPYFQNYYVTTGYVSEE
jgi:hypothetical protein